jgi:uncharacterized surface protein with fasciclin (FAS1) repeats
MRGAGYAAAALLSLGLAACDGKENAATENQAAATGTQETLAAAIGGAGDLSTTAKLLKDAGLDHTLEGVGSYTLFAPIDTAFASLPEGQRKTLENTDARPQLIALLSQHITTGYLSKPDLEKGLAQEGGSAKLTTMASGKPITLYSDNGTITIGSGTAAPHVVGEPITARNGVIYRIDRVIPDGG